MSEVGDRADEEARCAPGLRWGILAPGGIAAKLAEAVSRYTASTVLACGSRDLARARAFAADHGVERAYGSYEELVADPDVEVVYVASPHSHHREHALLAIEAGKPVLVEKALARNASEVDDIFAAARRQGVFAMEAMWTRHLPHIRRLREWLAGGAIGEVVSVTADHAQPLDLDAAHRVKNPDLAGGALLDLGVYPVAFVLDLLGAPESVDCVGHLTETGVDASETLTFHYPDPVVAQAMSSLKAAGPCVATVLGTRGRVELDGPFYTPTTMRRYGPERRPELLETFDGRMENGLQLQVAETARCISSGRQESERMSWQHSRDVIAVLDDCRRQLGVRYPGE